MGNIFSGSEIVEIAIQIEKNGKDFYDILASKAKNTKAQEIFRFLAGEEEKHKGIFQGILAKIEKYEPVESYPGEYFAYMNALAGESVFTQKNKGKEIAQKTKSDKEAIEIGIQAEKDSIVFYTGMEKVTPAPDQEVVEEVITQEQGHLQQLLEMKSKL